MADTPEVLSFRVQAMEQQIERFRGDFKEAVGSLGGGLSALQTQITTYQTQMSERYVLRREFDNRMAELDERLNQSANRVWFAVAALSAVVSAIASILAWVRPLH